jgi:hypothetical protein
LIGLGKISNVYSAMSINTGELVAFKVLHMNKGEFCKFSKQLHILYSLDHMNILKYNNVDNPYNEEKEGKLNTYIELVMITEYCGGGSLRLLLNKYGRFNENVIRLYVRQIIEGFIYLNHLGIPCPTVNTSNVLLDSNGVIKISNIYELENQKINYNVIEARSAFVNIALFTIELISKDYNLIDKEELDISYIIDYLNNLVCSELCQSFIIDCLNTTSFEEIKSHPFLINITEYEEEEIKVNTSEIQKPRERIYNILNTSEDNPMFTVSMTLNTPQSKLGRIFTNFANERKEVSPVDEIDSSKEYSPKDEEKKFFNEIL